MKKLLWVFGCLAFAQLQVFPKGTVSFRNENLTPIPLVYYGDPQAGGTPLVGTNWVAQLYYGAPGSPESSLNPVDSPPARFRAPGISPGIWRGGTRTLPGFFNVGLPNDPNHVDLQVRVWDSNIAPDYAAAYAMSGGLYTGKSTIFPYLVPDLTQGFRDYAMAWFGTDHSSP